MPWEGYPDPEDEADERGCEEPDALVFCTDPGYQTLGSGLESAEASDDGESWSWRWVCSR
jgi:hypothetical protein